MPRTHPQQRRPFGDSRAASPAFAPSDSQVPLPLQTRSLPVPEPSPLSALPLLQKVRIVSHAFDIVHLLTDSNPIQVLVDAIINRWGG